jgi:hypothetical protein
MKKTLLVATSIAILALGGFVGAQMARTKSPAAAKAYIISPKNGATVTSPVTVQFGLKGMGVAPAGVTNENTGHFHLLIDTDAMPDMTMPLPKTDKIVHFGGGQIETEVTLTPGKHTLQLLMADANHVPHDPPVMSEKITVTVGAAAAKKGATTTAPKASTTSKK